MSDEPIRYPWSRRLFRILLMAYPSGVRQQCGMEMWMTFRDRISAARHGSRTGFLRLWLMEIGAGLWNGCRERWKARSLRGRRDRSEKVENRGQIFSILRQIVVLFNEKSGKYGPIIPLSQQISSASQAPSSPWLKSD